MASFLSKIIAVCPEVDCCFSSLQQEVSVTFCPSHYNIHPDPHGFRRWGDHVVDSVMCLDTKGE